MNLSRTFDVAKYSDPEDVALGLILRRKDGTWSARARRPHQPAFLGIASARLRRSGG